MSNSEVTENELLSIVVPVYNVAPYLDRCVESLVNQTYSNIEIILVDDGSPDDCPQICDKWAAEDFRIKVIHKENGGLSDARNAGMEIATGEYLSFVDSDDYVDRDMYETMIGAMDKENSDIACCGRYVVFDDSTKERLTLDRQTAFSKTEAIKELLVRGCIDESVCDKVFKRELFCDIQFPCGEINEDLMVIPKVLDKAKSIVHVGLPFYYYCQQGVSITRSDYSSKNRIVLEHLNIIEQFLHEKHTDLLPYFDVLQNCYCQNALCMLLKDRHTYRQYYQDYHEFYSRFKHSFWTSMKLGKVSLMERIKGVLLYLNLYYLLHAIKKRRF